MSAGAAHQAVGPSAGAGCTARLRASLATPAPLRWRLLASIMKVRHFSGRPPCPPYASPAHISLQERMSAPAGRARGEGEGGWQPKCGQHARPAPQAPASTSTSTSQNQQNRPPPAPVVSITPRTLMPEGLECSESVEAGAGRRHAGPMMLQRARAPAHAPTRPPCPRTACAAPGSAIPSSLPVHPTLHNRPTHPHTKPAARREMRKLAPPVGVCCAARRPWASSTPSPLRRGPGREEEGGV